MQPGFHRLRDVREHLARATEEGWPYLPDSDGRNPHDPEQDWVLSCPR